MSNVETPLVTKLMSIRQVADHSGLCETPATPGLADSSFANSCEQMGRIEERHFKVALSFPGERRSYVEMVAEVLRTELPRGTVFYDKDFTSQLARPNLDTLLQRIYFNNSDLVVAFLCSDYDIKEWGGIEWRAIREIIKTRGDHRVMPMRFDQAVIPGFFSIDGSVDLNEHDPQQAARMIIERIRMNDLSKNMAGASVSNAVSD